MNSISRGVRNAFRNTTRTLSIVLILGLTIGLSLTMLVAQKAVDTKIKSVKSSIGNTVTIAPAGFTPGSQQNNALTTAELAKVAKLAHVTSVNQSPIGYQRRAHQQLILAAAVAAQVTQLPV